MCTQVREARLMDCHLKRKCGKVLGAMTRSLYGSTSYRHDHNGLFGTGGSRPGGQVATSVVIAKQRMGSEMLGWLQFGSQHFRGFIEILLAAGIAPDHEALIDSRARGDGICLGKGDSMPKEKVLPKMKPVVLAEHHPAIMGILPHTNTLLAMRMSGRGNR